MQTRAFIVLAVILSLVGCGRSREQAEREKQRLLAEEQAQREIQKSNQAVNDVSKKLGKKPPALDLGVPSDPKATPPPTDTKTQPAPKP